jgi:hypothetical protein
MSYLGGSTLAHVSGFALFPLRSPPPYGLVWDLRFVFHTNSEMWTCRAPAPAGVAVVP